MSQLSIESDKRTEEVIDTLTRENLDMRAVIAQAVSTLLSFNPDGR